MTTNPTLTPKETQPGSKEPDIIDRIGNALPPDLQKDYFKEMRYLRNLQETDELLRIIRIMQFLALLAEQVPSRILAQRELFDSICREVIEIVKKLLVSESKYFGELDRRLTQLPKDIEAGISPKAIVERIADILRKQFEITGIPALSKELSDNAASIKTTTKEYKRSSEELCGTWNSSADKAHRAIGEINTSVAAALEKSQKAITAIHAAVDEATKLAELASERISRSFLNTYYWMMGIVGTLGLIVGAGIIFWVFTYLNTDNQTANKSAPAVQQPVVSKPATTGKKKKP